MDSIVLLLFLLQQLGVTLSVGASTLALMFYILGLSDGQIDPSEKRFMDATYTTIRIGLFFIVTTGLAITAAHYLAKDFATLYEPAYLFKWLLILIIILNSIVMDARAISSVWGGIIAGASWYALFIIHTLSPISNWVTLIVLYGVWLIVFAAGFFLFRNLALSRYNKAKPQLLPSGPHIATGEGEAKQL